MRRIDWTSAGPRLLGALMLVFCLAFWAITDRVEPLFVTTGGGLLAIGQASQALGELRRPTDVPDVDDPPRAKHGGE